ncbi:MAG: FtsX-like permease family protein [Planctomycetes bacterium]|nr:FtsX-like permease family protein [Planctomycetota bacterium]
MTTIKLILKEIAHSRYNFALSLAAVSAGVALFVAFFALTLASDLETKKIMLDLGQNLRVIPKHTNMDSYYDQGFSDQVMPQDTLANFIHSSGLVYTHLTATLQRKMDWQGSPIIVTGVLPEVYPQNGKKKDMPTTFSITAGHAYVGHLLAEKHGLKTGDILDLAGHTLTVEQTLARSPNDDRDNIRIFMHLGDAQTILELPDQINEIKALECLCLVEGPDGDQAIDLEQLARDELAAILPDARVLLSRGIADIRQKQRAMIQKYAAFVMPMLCVALGLCLAVLALMNVRQRRHEIGIMRALGHGTSRISLLLLGKFVVIGGVAATVGFYVGTALAAHVGPDIFPITAQAIKPDYGLFQRAVVAAVAFSIVSAFIPVMMAISTDPARTLKND